MTQTLIRDAAQDDARIVTQATLRAADVLGISKGDLAQVIGVSPSFVTKLGQGTAVLKPDGKPFELALLFLRLFRSLDAIVGGDDATARDWMRNRNTVLGVCPRDHIRSAQGLIDTVQYLDQRRAIL